MAVFISLLGSFDAVLLPPLPTPWPQISFPCWTGGLFTVTNIYAPSSNSLRPEFLSHMCSLDLPADIPWLVCGDFHMIRFADEKNTGNFCLSTA